MAAVCSGGSCCTTSSISLPLQLPALIPKGPWPFSSTTCMIPKPKPKHSSSQHYYHHHLTPPALPSTRTPKKKPILTVTNINSNTTRGADASQSRPSSSSSSISEEVVYQGVYGPWTIQPSDVTEVVLYRTGLVTAAASFVLASTTIFLPYDTQPGGFLRTNLDLFYALGACGLGLSLYLIHIYVTEIKRTLQALWVLGALGSLVTYASFSQPAGKHLVDYVIQYPAATWLVGPLFAALTGLVFKEGLCYGKLEAGILTLVIPALLLGHLTGLMDEGVKINLLGIWMALFVVFAGRKFFQPIKDDIGDKSVFMFNSLTEEEKNALVRELEQQRNKLES